jgi:hypothetical protein
MGLADVNEAKFTPEVVAKMLAGYSDAAQAAVKSEAEVWRYGNVESARQSYDKARDWARRITPEQRRDHAWGAWHSNSLLLLAAISEVMREHGETMHDPGAEEVSDASGNDRSRA